MRYLVLLALFGFTIYPKVVNICYHRLYPSDLQIFVSHNILIVENEFCIAGKRNASFAHFEMDVRNQQSRHGQGISRPTFTIRVRQSSLRTCSLNGWQIFTHCVILEANSPVSEKTAQISLHHLLLFDVWRILCVRVAAELVISRTEFQIISLADRLVWGYGFHTFRTKYHSRMKLSIRLYAKYWKMAFVLPHLT